MLSSRSLCSLPPTVYVIVYSVVCQITALSSFNSLSILFVVCYTPFLQYTLVCSIYSQQYCIQSVILIFSSSLQFAILPSSNNCQQSCLQSAALLSSNSLQYTILPSSNTLLNFLVFFPIFFNFFLVLINFLVCLSKREAVGMIKYMIYQCHLPTLVLYHICIRLSSGPMAQLEFSTNSEQLSIY